MKSKPSCQDCKHFVRPMSRVRQDFCRSARDTASASESKKDWRMSQPVESLRGGDQDAIDKTDVKSNPNSSQVGPKDQD